MHTQTKHKTIFPRFVDPFVFLNLFMSLDSPLYAVCSVRAVVNQVVIKIHSFIFTGVESSKKHRRGEESKSLTVYASLSV